MNNLIKKTITLNENILMILAVIYIYSSIFIFFFGYLKPYISIPVAIITSYILYRLVKKLFKRTPKTIKIPLPSLFLLFLIILLLGYLIGWGGWTKQNSDWNKHNAVLHDLSERDWPVVYENSDQKSMLSYYIAAYLVPAIAGKITSSFHVAELSLYIWNVIGLILLLLFLLLFFSASTYKKFFAVIFSFIFFSGTLILAQSLCHIFYENFDSLGDLHYLKNSNFSILLQYSSFEAMLRWVFPQIITPCLAAMLLLMNKKRIDLYAPIILPILLYSSFSFIGLVIIFASYAIYALFRQKTTVLKQIFSIDNILSIISLGAIVVLYLIGNLLGKKPDTISFGLIEYGNEFGFYLIFCLSMFGIQALLIHKNYKKDPIFIFTILLLIIIPFFKLGLNNDFVMRASIIPLFIFFTYCLKFLFISKNFSSFSGGVLVTLLFIGAIYPLGEIIQNINSNEFGTHQREDNFKTLEKYANESLDCADDLKYNYYAYDLENNFFYQYLSNK